MTELERQSQARITFILCIKVDPALDLRMLEAQVASCRAVGSAKLLIGLSAADARLEASIAPFVGPRVQVAVLNDVSLYDGWNKAVIHTDTELVSFLGYGDCIINPRYYETVDVAGLDAVFARALVYSAQGDRLVGRPFNRRIHYWRQMIAMIGAIFRRELVVQTRFDPTLRIVGDYEFLLRAGRTLRSAFRPITAVSMPAGGLSESNFAHLMDEVRRVRRDRRRR